MFLLGIALGVQCPAEAAPSPPAPSPLSAPFDTGLAQAAVTAGPAEEHITVIGRGTGREAAPLPNYGDDPAPWEVAHAVIDPRTGTDTTVFGNAYNLGSPLGSDERGSATGSPLLAPLHH